MFKHSVVVLAVAVVILSAGTIVWSQDATPVKPDTAPARQDAASTKQDKPSDAAKQEAPTTSVAPTSVEITPTTLDAHVGEKVKFSAVAKDAAGNAIDEKPSVWFAAPFDLAGADEAGEVTFHAPGVVTVGAVIAGKTGYATVNVVDSKVVGVEIEPPAFPTVIVGGAEKLTAVTRTANGNPRTDVAVKWTSEKPSIAGVDAAGLVTGVSPGSVTINDTAPTAIDYAMAIAEVLAAGASGAVDPRTFNPVPFLRYR